MPTSPVSPRPLRLTIAVASGKGGTGKTLVATNLALAAVRSGAPAALVDCDADAPNDALFLVPEDVRVEPVTVPLPVVDADTCLLCGACRDACAFGAIRILGGQVLVFPELCHGCGACVTACVPRAIAERERRVGEVEWGGVAGADAGPAGIEVVTGRLDIGEVKTPSVIRAARERALVLARSVTILDAPPGVACAAVAAVRDADALVLVTEPTPFGLHDLELAVRLGRDMDLPMGVVINRDGAGGSGGAGGSDSAGGSGGANRAGSAGSANREGNADIGAYCAREGLPVLARIPFDRRVAEIYATGGLVIDKHPEGPAWFGGLWEAVTDLVAEADAR